MRIFDVDLIEDRDENWLKRFVGIFNLVLQYLRDAFNGDISTLNLKAQVLEFKAKDLGSPPQYPMFRTPKTKKGQVVGVFVCRIWQDNQQPFDMANSVTWHQEGIDLVIDNVQGATQGVNVRLLALYGE